MNSSPRPQSRTSNSSTKKSSGVTSSPRPQSRTSAPAAPAKSQSFTSSRAAGSNQDNQGQGAKTAPKRPTSGSPGAPPPQQVGPGTPIPPNRGDTPSPAPGSNPNLPADSVQASRGDRRADRTLIDALQQPGASRSAQKYRGTVLSSVYKLPADPSKSAKTLQQFNGPRGQRMTLGA
jgi:hypothetical protein